MLSKNQFLTDAKTYMDAIGPNYKESTVKDKRSKLNRVSKILYKMNQEKVISTNNPRRMKAADIASFVTYRRAHNVADSTINKDISMLKMFLKWLGNDAVEIYSVQYGTTRPQSYAGRLPPMDNDVIDRVYDLARATDKWKVLEGCVAVILGVACGLRPQESRQLYVNDVHLAGYYSTIYVRHVKGEGKWGHARCVPIMDGAHDIIQKYLEMRKQKLEELGRESEAMFPPLRGNSEFVCQQSFCRFKGEVEKVLGVKFQLRDGRRAYGQRALESGIPIKDVSTTMGHASTTTTERHYVGYDNAESVQAMLEHNMRNIREVS